VRGLTAPEGTDMSSLNGLDLSEEGMPEDGQQPGPSRRSVLHGAAGLAGVGLAATVMAGTLAAPASASAAPRAHPGRAARVSGSDEPVIVHVRDVRSGEMDVYAGTSQVRLRDPGLAARLTQAVR
jgi:hypothetical protein